MTIEQRKKAILIEKNEEKIVEMSDREVASSNVGINPCIPKNRSVYAKRRTNSHLKIIARKGKKSTFGEQIVDLRWFMSMVKLKM